MRLFPALLLTLTLTAEARRPKPMPAPEQAPAELMGQALADDGAWHDLVELCDDIGARFSGTPELDRAIAWAQAKMTDRGLTNVRAEPIVVPQWVRGHERATLLGTAERDLHILTLGRSIGTGDSPLEADVLVVTSFDELASRSPEAKGRVVLFNVPFTTYKETVAYRSGGPIAAAKHGALGVLVRSVGPDSLDTPHTGGTRYEEGTPQIPAAAITIEGAELLARLQERGKTPRIRLDLGAKTLPDVPSANVIGEIVGREKPEEVVVLACHLDSWDVGQGAQDDGAGCVAALHAASLIGRYRVQPRRTLRVVFYTNEENGLAGGRGYAEAHASDRHVAAIESDSGAGAPHGLRVLIPEGQQADAILPPLRKLAAPLSAIHADGIREGYSGADIGPLSKQGVLTFGIDHDTTDYFRIHHTEADTIDKIDPSLLQYNVATMTVWAWILAETDSTVIPSTTLRGK